MQKGATSSAQDGRAATLQHLEESNAVQVSDCRDDAAPDVPCLPEGVDANEIWEVPASARTGSSVGAGSPVDVDADPADWDARCSILSGSKAFGPINRQGEWLQLDLSEPGSVSGVVTKGLVYTWHTGVTYHGWVSHYKVQYLEDKVWQYVDGGRVFAGNFDAFHHVAAFFESPVLAESFRIETVDWARPGGTCLKVDLLRHQTVCLTLEPAALDASTVAIAVTDLGGTEIASIQFDRGVPCETLWRVVAMQVGKPQRWLRLMLLDGSLLAEPSSEDAKQITLGKLLGMDCKDDG